MVQKNDQSAIIDWLKQNLDDKRYRHSLGVRDVACTLARAYGADEKQIALAALLHDAGRSIDTAEGMTAYCHKHRERIPAGYRSRSLLHAYAGAAIARVQFGIRDKDIIDAIRFHTTGGRSMTLFSKIVYIADLLDPNRKIPGTRALYRKALCDFDGALIEAVRLSIAHVMKKRQIIAAASIEIYNELAAKAE